MMNMMMMMKTKSDGQGKGLDKKKMVLMETTINVYPVNS